MSLPWIRCLHLFGPATAKDREAWSWPRPRSLFAGIAFILEKPAILGAISLDLFAVLLGGATALLPVYAQQILVVGPLGLGLLRSAPAIGALFMSLFLARRPLKGRMGRTMFGAVILFGLATMVFAVSSSFPLSLGPWSFSDRLT